tara:strand:- start:236 stop:457 length:222 start_codon:yes stop_codon:yes gene_type:complete
MDDKPTQILDDLTDAAALLWGIREDISFEYPHRVKDTAEQEIYNRISDCLLKVDDVIAIMVDELDVEIQDSQL